MKAWRFLLFSDSSLLFFRKIFFRRTGAVNTWKNSVLIISEIHQKTPVSESFLSGKGSSKNGLYDFIK